jgi:hypothetical protein
MGKINELVLHVGYTKAKHDERRVEKVMLVTDEHGWHLMSEYGKKTDCLTIKDLCVPDTVANAADVLWFAAFPQGAPSRTQELDNFVSALASYELIRDMANLRRTHGGMPSDQIYGLELGEICDNCVNDALKRVYDLYRSLKADDRIVHHGLLSALVISEDPVSKNRIVNLINKTLDEKDN